MNYLVNVKRLFGLHRRLSQNWKRWLLVLKIFSTYITLYQES